MFGQNWTMNVGAVMLGLLAATSVASPLNALQARDNWEVAIYTEKRCPEDSTLGGRKGHQDTFSGTTTKGSPSLFQKSGGMLSPVPGHKSIQMVRHTSCDLIIGESLSECEEFKGRKASGCEEVKDKDVCWTVKC